MHRLNISSDLQRQSPDKKAGAAFKCITTTSIVWWSGFDHVYYPPYNEDRGCEGLELRAAEQRRRTDDSGLKTGRKTYLALFFLTIDFGWNMTYKWECTQKGKLFKLMNRLKESWMCASSGKLHIFHGRNRCSFSPSLYERERQRRAVIKRSARHIHRFAKAAERRVNRVSCRVKCARGLFTSQWHQPNVFCTAKWV